MWFCWKFQTPIVEMPLLGMCRLPLGRASSTLRSNVCSSAFQTVALQTGALSQAVAPTCICPLHGVLSGLVLVRLRDQVVYLNKLTSGKK